VLKTHHVHKSPDTAATHSKPFQTIEQSRSNQYKISHLSHFKTGFKKIH